MAGRAEPRAEHAAAAAGDAFSSIEASHAYVARLLEVVEETAGQVGEDLRSSHGEARWRREALQVAAYKLQQLRLHLAVNRRRLGELRALRLILDGEVSAERATAERRGEAA